jgi:hypothetical protein
MIIGSNISPDFPYGSLPTNGVSHFRDFLSVRPICTTYASPAAAVSFSTLVPGREKRGPGLAGFGAILGGAAGNCRNTDQVMAVGTLNLAARCLIVALQVLLTVRTGEFELVHRSSGGWLCFVATELNCVLSFPAR